MVGHLRDEKDPRTYWRAAQRLAARHDIRLDHIGDALDPALGAEAAALAARQPRYRWLGRAAARRRRAAASRPPTCWCTPAAWKAARTW